MQDLNATLPIDGGPIVVSNLDPSGGKGAGPSIVVRDHRGEVVATLKPGEEAEFVAERTVVDLEGGDQELVVSWSRLPARHC